MLRKKILRFIFVLIGAIIGYEIYQKIYFIPDLSIYYNILYYILAIIIGGMVGY